MTIRITDDRMCESTSHHVAVRVGTDVWRVSWLDGYWDRSEAMTALTLAELAVTDNPSPKHRAAVATFLAELDLPAAALARITGRGGS